MEDVKAQLANRLKEANNVLVSVTNSPSVDQFAAAIALTLILNKLGKHATTVFSGTIPSTIEFLQPEKVVEKNTDSLRDFIISLDKSKADKLRYKIEDNFVKIFITPYHSSISRDDLVFSQGDFNVDVIVGLGVHRREELDQAITAHGRILHDATVTTINTQPPSNLGSVNWADSKASSLCEMLVGMSDLLAKQGLFDTQISNALLTGIVAETQRFSNQKTTSATMGASSKLLASGANQQLVATQLTPKPAPPPPPPPPIAKTPPPPKNDAKPDVVVDKTPPPEKKTEDGTLQIDHGPKPTMEPQVTQVLIDEQGNIKSVDDSKSAHEPDHPAPLEPPKAVVAPPPPPPALIMPPPAVNLPPVPEYIPPPLIAIPPDAPASESPPMPLAPPPLPPVPPEDNSMPLPPPYTPLVQPPAGNMLPPSPPVGEDSNRDPNSFLNGPKLVLEPPSMAGQINASQGAMPDAEGFSDPLSGPGQGIPPANIAAPSLPLLNHDSGPALPPSHVDQPPALPSLDSNLGALPSLSDVRNAVDAALSTDSSTSSTVSNQPLASLNAQPLGLNLNPPTPGQGLGDSMQPQITQPPPSPNTAPPVPPPIISLNDNNLPPSFTAL